MSARPPVGGNLYDALVRDLLGRVEEMIDARTPTLGTVVGRDGGKVRLRLDDEDEDRVIGFERALGVAYDTGDRVPVLFSRAGRPMVAGVVGGGGNDRRVRNEQLDTNSVDDRALKSVNGNGDVDHKHLRKTLSDEIKAAATTKQLDDKTKDFVKDGNGDNKIVREGGLKNLAKQSEIERIDRKIRELETKIARSDKRKDKGNR